MSIWGELRRRKVVRACIAYLAGAWLLLQVASIVLPSFDAPGWIMQALIFAAAAGFPVTVLLAWIYEITPKGVVRTEDLPKAEDAAFSGRSTFQLVVSSLFAGALLGSGLVWLLNSNSDEQWLREQRLPQIETLLQDGDWEAAFTLAEETEARVPEDANLESLWPRFSWVTSILSDPPGATAYRRAYSASDEEWRRWASPPWKTFEFHSDCLA